MIRLSPDIDLNISCPICTHNIQASEWSLTGMHSICYLQCSACGGEFYMEMPVNSGLFYPGILDAKTGKRVDKMPFENWYLHSLQDAFKSRKSYSVGFRVEHCRALTSGKKLVILNTIDATYGHALYELFNASYYLQQPDIDLVILVQKNIRWMVPDGAAQIWTVDISFSKANDWNDWLAKRIHEELATQKEVYLCRSFVQADSNDFNIEDYTKVKPFPLYEWDKRLEKPTVTFIWRTDRFWRRVLSKWIDNRGTRKFFPHTIEKVRNRLQFRWILEFSKQLKEEIPEIDFAIAGMDSREHKLPTWIKDFRYEIHMDDTALEQCRRYAESHLVLGCNGSSLLLPGCHSGGVIDIVPMNQWAVSAGTFPFRITSIADTHFRYLMLPAEVSIKRLVSILVSMLRDRSYILIQSSSPWSDHETNMGHFEWAKFRVDTFNLHRHFRSRDGMISTPKQNNNASNS